ncbi:MAG: parallel beta-helix domain-containing protein [Myxococcales bacterium]|nr:right-handed parallel beta-helix repeat-containing protein [Myxococcota bacterium]MDW8284242.1 parallel beta-helix domain-containing protein [Myxococcales bacterium]
MRCFSLALVVLLLPLAGCEEEGVLRPGANDHETLQQALLAAQPGDVIQLGEGTFRLQRGLSLTVSRVTLRGRGPQATVLSFRGQTEGSQGLLVKADEFLLEDLGVEDTAGDAVKVEGGKGVTFRRVRVEWTRGPSPDNGAYGLYPVQCERVLIEDCAVSGASDAGIYVGQSDTIIVRRNRAERNVAGIEIENSKNADVHDNILTGNTGGILVFDLPGLQVKGGRHVRVYNNQVHDNNEDNFAPPGNIVGQVPRGTGMFVMANDHVEVFGNTLRNNRTVSLAVISYLVTGLPIEDPAYDPYPESIYIHDNTFEGGGDSPDPTRQLSLAIGIYLRPIPDVIYDGLVDPKKLREGRLPDELRLCIRNNRRIGGTFGFANIDAANLPSGMPRISRDLGPHDCAHPPLSAVSIPGVGP